MMFLESATNLCNFNLTKLQVHNAPTGYHQKITYYIPGMISDNSTNVRAMCETGPENTGLNRM